MPTEVAALAAEENIRGNVLEISCAKCRRFLGEFAVESKGVGRIRCAKCHADIYLVVSKDRLTYVQRGQTVTP